MPHSEAPRQSRLRVSQPDFSDGSSDASGPAAFDLAPSAGPAAAFDLAPSGPLIDVPGSEEQRACETCGRTFLPEALARHARVCVKVFQQRRKPFNAERQRAVEGAAAYRRGAPAAPPAANWRAKSGAFRAQVRLNREITRREKAGQSLAGLQAPAPAPELDDRVPCRYCGRKFNRDVAERHIPKCATTLNRPAPPRRARG